MMPIARSAWNLKEFKEKIQDSYLSYYLTDKIFET